MITQHKSFFLIGIKGAAMVHIAAILQKMKKKVAGIDSDEVFPTDEVLNRAGIAVLSASLEELPEDVDVVIFSGAHGGSEHQLVKQAVEKGIVVVHQAEFLGELIKAFKISLGVAGCHGKTTTSSILAYTMNVLGLQPSYLVGTPSFNECPGGDYQGKKFFVFEADEYAINPPHDKTSKLEFLQPTYSIITNIDFDHPDVYLDLEQTKDVFLQYMQKIVDSSPDKPHLILCKDDQPLMEVAQLLPKGSYLTYGYDERADYVIRHVAYSEQGTSFAIAMNDRNIDRFTISLYGEKNVSNAAGVIALLLQLGNRLEDIRLAITGFLGAKRRFEKMSYKKNIYVFDDYAHHPEEIKAVIYAARRRFPDRKIKIFFQPHTYSRTEHFKDEFVTALGQADAAYIAPIFASAREKESSNMITAKNLQTIAQQKMLKNIFAAESINDMNTYIDNAIERGDVLITAGAGDVYKYIDHIDSVISQLK